jgi:hypothetical protein
MADDSGAKTVVSAGNGIAVVANPQTRPQPDQQEQQRSTTGQAGLSAIGAGQNIYAHYRAVQSGDTNGASISGVNAARDLGDPGRAYSEATRAAGAHKVYQGPTGWREANRLSTVTSGSLNMMDRLARRAEAGARIDREIADLAERAQRDPGILERLRRFLRDIDVP